MHEYRSINKIFLDIHTFIIDYIKLSEAIHENSNQTNGSIINIKLGKEDFYLPATFNEFSQRADELQHRLQRQIRILAQKRRNDISKGVETNNKNLLIDNQYRFDDEFKIRLEQLQKNLSNKNINRIQIIIDSFELYDDIQTKNSFSNITFRLLPVIKHIEKQLCCISKNIQKILDNNTGIIKQHLRKLQQNLNLYDKDMRNKLAKYISRDIRPPVLVIPCPTNTYSPEILSQMKSSNAVIDEKDSNHNLIQITSVSSEDSLSMEED